MKIYQAIIVSIVVPAILIGFLHMYGLTSKHKIRKHPILGQTLIHSFTQNHQKQDYKTEGLFLDILIKDEKLWVSNSPEVLLEDLFKKHKTIYLLNISQDSEKINFLINKLVDKYSLHENVIFTSRYGNIIQNIREVSPRWLTTLTTNELLRLIILKKFYLETLAPIPSAYVFIHHKIIDPKWWSEIPIEEILRRKKHFLIEASFEKLDLTKNYLLVD